MKSSFHLCRIMGIPLGINYTWFIIFSLVTVSLSHYYFPFYYRDWSTATCWVVGLSTSLLFFASVVAHELAHSFVSIRSGIPVKSITLFILGGVARISREASRPATDLAMAVAGPISSVALAGLFALVWLLTKGSVETVAAMSSYLAWINLVLAAFNMVPGFPLDGGRVLRSLVWGLSGSYRRATRIATLAGQGFAYLFILGGVAIMLFVSWVSGLWLAFIGGFLYIAATASYRQAMLRDTIQSFTARDLMTDGCHAIPTQVTIEDVVRTYFSPSSHRCLRVEEWGQLWGIITPHSIKMVAKKQWSSTTAAEAMTPLGKLRQVYPGDGALTVLERLDEEGIGLVAVMSEGKVIGFIERDSLLQFSKTRSELGI